MSTQTVRYSVHPPAIRRWWSDTFWAAVANLSLAAGPFLGLLLLTRAQGLHAAGQFAFAQAVTAPLALMLNSQLKALMLTHSEAELSLATALAVRLLSSIPAVALSCGLAIGLSPLVGIWMVARLVDSWAEVFQAQEQRMDRMPRAALSVALRAVLLVTCLSVQPDLERAAVWYASLSLLLLIISDWGFSAMSIRLRWSALEPVLRRGAMLGLILCLQALSGSVPRVVLERCTDPSVLGLFATLSVTVQTGNLMASSFGQGLLPSMGKASRKQILMWAAIPMMVALVALLLEQKWESTLFEVFHIAATPLARELLLSLGMAQLIVWPSAMIGYALTAKRLYKELLWVGLGIATTSAVASFALIPVWGASGAAIAMTLSAAATLGLSFWFLAKEPLAG
jgi:O-antigen/teichoic acid export membrane protein